MLTLNDILHAVDKLSRQEKHQLRKYLEEREEEFTPVLSAEDRAERLEEAAAKIREGFAPEQLFEITAAMNEEYVEPFNETIWKD